MESCYSNKKKDFKFTAVYFTVIAISYCVIIMAKIKCFRDLLGKKKLSIN